MAIRLDREDLADLSVEMLFQRSRRPPPPASWHSPVIAQILMMRSSSILSIIARSRSLTPDRMAAHTRRFALRRFLVRGSASKLLGVTSSSSSARSFRKHRSKWSKGWSSMKRYKIKIYFFHIFSSLEINKALNTQYSHIISFVE
jgi:hypothetical protein